MKVSECCGEQIIEGLENNLCSQCLENCDVAMEIPPKPVQPQIDFIKVDLLKVIDNLEALEQKVINLNFKVNQHKKEGHIPYENKQNIGSRIVFDSGSRSSRGPITDN